MTSRGRFRLPPVEPRVLYAALALVLGAALAVLLLLGLPGSDVFAPLPDDPSVTVSLAGSFPPVDEAALDNPMGIALVGRRICVAQSTRAAVSLFDLNGKLLREFELPPADGARIAAPAALAPVGMTRVACVDAAARRVVVMRVAGIGQKGILFTLGEGDPATAPVRPWGVAYGRGVYYIADGATRTIKMYDRDGGYIGLLRDGDPLPVEAPSGLAYGGDHLVVSDSANGRVALVALSDGVQDVIDPATYSLPRAVAALPGGYAVADVLGRTIAVGTDVAERSHMVDAQRVPDWPLGGPEGVVWVQRTGRLYVSDAIRGRIVVFNLRR